MRQRVGYDTLNTAEKLCSFAARWKIDPGLADALRRMIQELPFAIEMISGGRTRAEQQALTVAGRPTAPFDLSTHSLEDENGCPRLATGMDIGPLVAPVPMVKAALGAAGVFAGLRWGGRSDGQNVDPETGIPADWRHFDLGPRWLARIPPQ